MEKQSVIIEDMEHCYLCGSPYIHIHHVFFGTSNRKNSDKYGYTVPLCQEHHTGSAGVHFNKPFDLHLKKFAQEHFEANLGDRNDFRAIFGKSYL